MGLTEVAHHDTGLIALLLLYCFILLLWRVSGRDAGDVAWRGCGLRLLELVLTRLAVVLHRSPLVLSGRRGRLGLSRLRICRKRNFRQNLRAGHLLTQLQSSPFWLSDRPGS
jgi:hypothetical protein